MGVGRVEIDGEHSRWVPQQTGTKAGKASVDVVRRSLASRPFDRPRRKRRVQIESFVHLPCLGGVVLEGTVLLRSTHMKGTYHHSDTQASCFLHIALGARVLVQALILSSAALQKADNLIWHNLYSRDHGIVHSSWNTVTDKDNSSETPNYYRWQFPCICTTLIPPVYMKYMPINTSNVILFSCHDRPLLSGCFLEFKHH